MRFGTAGIPLACERNTLKGIECVKRLGLGAMEMEFVHGVRMGRELAARAGELARKEGVLLTAHAPYFINLLSRDPDKVEASIKRIIDTAIITGEAGGYSIVFHAAYYGGLQPEKATRIVASRISEVVEQVKALGVNVWIRPETAGKVSQWGSLEETIAVSQEVDQVLPCVDFAHLHARTNGALNSKEEWRAAMELIESELGREAVKNMHIHISGINYGPRGERNHLPLEESDLRWRDLIDTLKEFGADGVIVSESPNIEKDALLMKKYWEGKL